MRKTMARYTIAFLFYPLLIVFGSNVYLSGGAALTPGLQERLAKEVERLLPTSMAVTVHASMSVMWWCTLVSREIVMSM
jgi:hypothetical protein